MNYRFSTNKNILLIVDANNFKFLLNKIIQFLENV